MIFGILKPLGFFIFNFVNEYLILILVYIDKQTKAFMRREKSCTKNRNTRKNFMGFWVFVFQKYGEF